MKNAGYKRIASGNLPFQHLPYMIPFTMELKKNAAYLFHVVGHAVAVGMKKSLKGRLGEMKLSDPSSSGIVETDYFVVKNEKNYNYKDGDFDRNVIAIWSSID